LSAILRGDNSDEMVALVELGLMRSDDVVLDSTLAHGVFWKQYRHPPDVFIGHDNDAGPPIVPFPPRLPVEEERAAGSTLSMRSTPK
jgi:hypothetical protein